MCFLIILNMCSTFTNRSLLTANCCKHRILLWRNCFGMGISTQRADRSNLKTHFGFQTVRESEKGGKVHKVFEDVSKSYDFMNDFMSAGIHRLWKDAFIDKLGPVPGTSLLDMAGGTGDIAFRYIKYLQNLHIIQEGESNCSHVTISDINQHMLDVGKIRSEQLGYNNKTAGGIYIDWVCADAEKLPFVKNSFDAYTIAFGIRNCTRIDKVLREARRVLKPGGRLMCLEFSSLTKETLQRFYDHYSFKVIPSMGQILVGQWDAYQYLVESIRKFPSQEEFKLMLEQSGFHGVSYENITFGVVSMHSGFKF